MIAPDFQCVNEVVGDSLSVSDRGLAFGDGLFETMRVEDGKIALWDYHRERLLAGLRALNIEVSLDRLNTAFIKQQQWFESNATAGQGVCKLIVSRGNSPGGYQYSSEIEANIILSFSFKTLRNGTQEHLYKSSVPVYENSTLAGIKHLNRLENVLARRQAEIAGYSDAVLTDGDGCLLETTSSNLFFVADDSILVTPRLNAAGVEGVMKRFIVERAAPLLGLKVVFQDVRWDDLPNFLGCFKCNAVQGVTPIASMAFYRFPACNLIDSLRECVSRQAWVGGCDQREFF